MVTCLEGISLALLTTHSDASSKILKGKEKQNESKFPNYFMTCHNVGTFFLAPT